MSDRVAVMNGGVLEQVGSPQEIYQNPRTRFVASFLGAMNWIDGVGVRPEAIRVSRIEPQGCGSRRGTVTRSVFLGSLIQTEIQTERGERVLSQRPVDANAFTEGELVHLCWSKSDELQMSE